MLIAILGDQHMGCRKSSQLYWDYFDKFYTNIFFPKLKELGITTIIQLGDVYDDRKNLSLDTIYKSKKLFFDKLKDITLYTLVGNHDVFHKDTNYINSPSLVLREYKNVFVYDKCYTLDFMGRKIDIIPWINSENYEETLDFIKHSNSRIACGHLEIHGALLFPGHALTHGTDPNIFSNYTKVLSGHIHFRSIYQNIHYIGNPYQLNFGDENAMRGFTILDTATLKTNFIRNPYQLYKTIYYDTNLDVFDTEQYSNCIVKIIVKKIDSTQDFDNYIDKIEAVAYSVKIIQSNDTLINTDSFTDDTMINSSTLELFEEYLIGVDIGDKTNDIMNIVKTIYQKVL